MPQFDFANVFVPQFAWLALFFVILYFGVVQQTLPKLGKVMGQREDKISGDIAAARAAKEVADSTSEAYEADLAVSRDAARTTIAEAKLAAAKASEVRLSKAAAKADAEIGKAETRIAKAVADAEANLRDIAAEGAQSIVARLTGKEPTAAAARKAVEAQA